MRAWMLHDIGNIRLSDTDVPVPGPGEVRIKVMATGICGSDIPRIYNTGAHRMPLIPGHEFSGIVEEAGSATGEKWIGKRVGVYPLIPCMDCGPCRHGHFEMCRNYDYVGSRRDGAFAEYVTVPASNLIELPDVVSSEEAAMLEPMAVAVHAMRKGLDGFTSVSTKDARIVVCGLGTIGMLMTMFLIERGYENIYVIGNKDFQKNTVTKLGIPSDHYCDSRRMDARTVNAGTVNEGAMAAGSKDVISWLKNTVGGADFYFECVGRNECVSYGVESAAAGGRIILVGNPNSDMALDRDTYWKILRNQLTINGTWNSSFLQGGEVYISDEEGAETVDDWHYVLHRLEQGRIKPEQLITHRLRIDDLEQGFHVMRDKTEDYCKIMMVR